MRARDRSVEGKRNVVRWRQTDRDPVAPKGDPVSRAPDPHLEMIVPLALRAIAGRIRSRDVTHGDGNLPPHDGSVALQRWDRDRPPRMIVSMGSSGAHGGRRRALRRRRHHEGPTDRSGEDPASSSRHRPVRLGGARVGGRCHRRLCGARGWIVLAADATGSDRTVHVGLATRSRDRHAHRVAVRDSCGIVSNG